MLFYVLRRALAVVPILLGVSVICFALVHLAPGDAINAITPDNATPEVIAAIRKAYGFDRPLPIQYFDWLGLVLHGNLGTSILDRPLGGRGDLSCSAAHVHSCRLRHLHQPVCGTLNGDAGWLYAPSLGRTPADIVRDPRRLGTALLGGHCPGRCVFREAPAVTGHGNGPGHRNRRIGLNDISFIILPALTLSLIPTAIIARTTRATIIETRKNDFVQMLRSVGLGRYRIVLHVAKNAAPAILDSLGAANRAAARRLDPRRNGFCMAGYRLSLEHGDYDAGFAATARHDFGIGDFFRLDEFHRRYVAAIVRSTHCSAMNDEGYAVARSQHGGRRTSTDSPTARLLVGGGAPVAPRSGGNGLCMRSQYHYCGGHFGSGDIVPADAMKNSIAQRPASNLLSGPHFRDG